MKLNPTKCGVCHVEYPLLAVNPSFICDDCCPKHRYRVPCPTCVVARVTPSALAAQVEHLAHELEAQTLRADLMEGECRVQMTRAERAETRADLMEGECRVQMTRAERAEEKVVMLTLSSLLEEVGDG